MGREKERMCHCKEWRIIEGREKERMCHCKEWRIIEIREGRGSNVIRGLKRAQERRGDEK